MHHEKTDRSFREFPDFFQSEQLIHGFEWQDGWFELIRTLTERIRHDSFAIYHLSKSRWFLDMVENQL